MFQDFKINYNLKMRVTVKYEIDGELRRSFVFQYCGVFNIVVFFNIVMSDEVLSGNILSSEVLPCSLENISMSF
jgi:hypothetical protein